MKRALILLLVSASLALAQDVRLPRTTLMRSGNQLITLPPGTVVKMIEQGEKTVTIKVADKVGTIAWTSLDAEEPRRPLIVRHVAPGSVSPSTATQASHQPAPPPHAGTPPPTPRPAQSTYGRMVEKARQNESAHHKNLVAATNEVLAGK